MVQTSRRTRQPGGATGADGAETGGSQLPSGTPRSETQSVTVTNGVFNVLLGSVTDKHSGVEEQPRGC